MKTFYYRHNKFDKAPHGIGKSTLSYDELTFVLKGSLVYEVDSERKVINSGDCIYIKKGSVRKREPANSTDYVSFNFHATLGYDLPVLITDAVNSEINLLLTACDGIYLKYYEWSNMIDGILTAILELLKQRLLTRQVNPVIVKIERYVRENLSKKLTLKNIASHVGYSPNYCDTLFKEYTNQPILTYVIDKRISEAKLLLIEGVLPLKEIAATCGFEDYNYFSRIFKQKTDYTPTEYKNKNN